MVGLDDDGCLCVCVFPENLNKLGKYTLHLQTILNENNSSVWAGKQLPSYTLNFTLTGT